MPSEPQIIDDDELEIRQQQAFEDQLAEAQAQDQAQAREQQRQQYQAQKQARQVQRNRKAAKLRKKRKRQRRERGVFIKIWQAAGWVITALSAAIGPAIVIIIGVVLLLAVACTQNIPFLSWAFYLSGVCSIGGNSSGVNQNVQ